MRCYLTTISIRGKKNTDNLTVRIWWDEVNGFESAHNHTSFLWCLHSWLQVKIKVGNVVKSFLSLLMDFLFSFNSSSISRLSHDTHWAHHIPPLELLKWCFQTQELYVWGEWLIHFSSSPSCKPPLGLLIRPACFNIIRTSRINTVLHTADKLYFCFLTFNYCSY